MQSVSKLSKLQKRILAEGLKAFWNAPVRRAKGRRDEDSFGIAEILRDFFKVDNDVINRRYRRQQSALPANQQARRRLASPRAALSRAMSRLTKRGFLERIKPTGRGTRRLTAKGIEAATLLCPTLLKPTRTEMLPKIKRAYLERKGRLERAGQEMPITWKDFCAGCFLQPQKIGKRPGVKVELDLTGI